MPRISLTVGSSILTRMSEEIDIENQDKVDGSKDQSTTWHEGALSNLAPCDHESTSGRESKHLTGMPGATLMHLNLGLLQLVHFPVFLDLFILYFA